MPAAHTWHLITCEYAPQVGGVADFTRVIARGLAAAGQRVHVWSPAPAAGSRDVAVHELADGYRMAGLESLDRALESCPTPRRLLVQWVPHGYGYKSLNVPFCFWVRKRAHRGDEVHLIVHEPFLSFERRRLRQNVGAIVHRFMLRTLLGAARRVWVSTPSFLPDVRRFGPRGGVEARWLPIPSPVAPVHDPAGVEQLRAQLVDGAPLIGHFGTCNPLVTPILTSVIEQLCASRSDLRFALLGRGTEAFARQIIERGRVQPSAIAACGERAAPELSRLLQCCDVFVQPYPDGLSSRRTTAMALLQHGCAIVASAGERTEACWRESDLVRLTPLGDTAAMTAAALTLLDEPATRRALGERARCAYLSRFDARRAIDALVDGAAV